MIYKKDLDKRLRMIEEAMIYNRDLIDSNMKSLHEIVIALGKKLKVVYKVNPLTEIIEAVDEKVTTIQLNGKGKKLKVNKNKKNGKK